jgi:acetyl-CoA decarbonylase/synthase complex subunit gamma
VPGFIDWYLRDGRKIPRISTELSCSDRLGGWKVRWGIGRMSYLVPAGLYAVGTPDEGDPVLVTANYKMSYDMVRSVLSGRNVWLLVLETFGINVWCAAGKGTFGTEELVHRVEATGVAGLVSHRRLLLPILGAPGVASHEVARRTGFRITYATIRAGDLPEFLDNGMETTSAMREMTFSLYERLVLVPVDLAMALKPMAVGGGILYAVFALYAGSVAGLAACIAYAGAVVAGVAVAPLLLPLLPGRSFSVKGAVAGAIWTAVWTLFAQRHGMADIPVVIAAFLVLPAISSFYTLNFTGSTNFTSRSGVKKEMRIALPVMGGAILAGIVALATGLFV